MTATPSRTPRTPTYRTGPSTEPWQRDKDDHGHVPCHRAYEWTPAGFTVAAIVERAR